MDVVRFEWAQVIAFDGASEIPTRPEDLSDSILLKLGLQPYLSLLELNYPVDEFVAAVKKQGTLRSEASNIKMASSQGEVLEKVAFPKRGKVYLAVHRYDNIVYYKRLAPEAYILLLALRKGATVERACARALRDASEETDWVFQIRSWFENWSKLGWFYKKL